MNTDLCQYKNLFGKPNEGVHKYKILGISIVDIAAVIIPAYLISKYTKQDFKQLLLIFFLFGIIIHKLFCVDSTVNKLLFRS